MVIYESSLFKYFSKNFTDVRKPKLNVTIPDYLTGATRKITRKRNRYYAYIDILTKRLYWITKIAYHFTDNFKETELYNIRNTLINIEGGYSYSEIPYEKELYDKIRKVVHNVIKNKISIGTTRGSYNCDNRYCIINTIKYSNGLIEALTSVKKVPAPSISSSELIKSTREFILGMYK